MERHPILAEQVCDLLQDHVPPAHIGISTTRTCTNSFYTIVTSRILLPSAYSYYSMLRLLLLRHPDQSSNVTLRTFAELSNNNIYRLLVHNSYHYQLEHLNPLSLYTQKVLNLLPACAPNLDAVILLGLKLSAVNVL